MKQNVLLVDDEPAVIFGFSKYLSKAGYNVKGVSSLEEARQATASQRFDAVLLDMRLPDGNGIDWIDDLRRVYPSAAIIVITAGGDVPTAVEAMRRGADNFLIKPVSLSNLEIILRKSLELGALRRKDDYQQRLSMKFQPFWGESRGMKKVIEMAAVTSETDAPVLLMGETGVGKGVLAKWIHERSPRASAPFVEVNCSALRGELLASELFGHAKGAFTSAVIDKQGLMDMSDGGTLFLDEIGDMDVTVQAQFLKVIEEKSYRRLGDVNVRFSDFRPICATGKNLRDEAMRGVFRKDLYFRIGSFPILIPPLRERLEDLPALVGHLLGVLGSPVTVLSPEVMRMLGSYGWPGNVRELKNALERALLLARGGPVGPEHFSELDLLPDVLDQGISRDLDGLIEGYIKTVIERSGGDIAKAAKVLGMSRATIYRKLKKLRGPD
ncbi:MAG: sigma-54-dependent Fis family transcriptional regulator [Nitrospirae bacterium]|nr:sigma-54-dependent Fis family transcriptional regulator [Nitrospirota bacterium]